MKANRGKVVLLVCEYLGETNNGGHAVRASDGVDIFISSPSGERFERLYILYIYFVLF
jgi:hypothetical protein